MPGSIEAALVFAVLMVPGLLLISGYNRTRAHMLPGRDLYALAQAVAVSLAWLPVLWLLGGRCVFDWIDAGTARDHAGGILAIVAANLAVPAVAGLLAGRAVDWVGERPWTLPARAVRWTGIFEPPTAWEHTWLYALEGQWAAIEITLKDGTVFAVLFDSGSRVGLAPGPRYLFFDSEIDPEYSWESDADPQIKANHGVFIDATEVRSVRIRHIEW